MQKKRELPYHLHNKMEKHLSLEEKATVIAYKRQGLSRRKISEITRIPLSTVQRTINNRENRDSLIRKPSIGRKGKLDKEEIIKIVEMVNKDPRISATKITSEINSVRYSPISIETIRNALRYNGYNARKICKKPLLSSKNRKLRYTISNLKWST
jgi:transposase